MDDGANWWKFYLPDPAFAEFVEVTELEHGKTYWINVAHAQTVTLGVSVYDLNAGWNHILWKG